MRDRGESDCPLDSLAYGTQAKKGVLVEGTELRLTPGKLTMTCKKRGLSGAGAMFLSHLMVPCIPDRPLTSSLSPHSLISGPLPVLFLSV